MGGTGTDTTYNSPTCTEAEDEDTIRWVNIPYWPSLVHQVTSQVTVVEIRYREFTSPNVLVAIYRCWHPVGEDRSINSFGFHGLGVPGFGHAMGADPSPMSQVAFTAFTVAVTVNPRSVSVTVWVPHCRSSPLSIHSHIGARTHHDNPHCSNPGYT
jgi:hypothetical protein